MKHRLIKFRKQRLQKLTAKLPVHAAKESIMRNKGSTLSRSVSQRQASCLSLKTYSLGPMSPHLATEPPCHSTETLCFPRDALGFPVPQTPVLMLCLWHRFPSEDRCECLTDRCCSVTFSFSELCSTLFCYMSGKWQSQENRGIADSSPVFFSLCHVCCLPDPVPCCPMSTCRLCFLSGL